MTINFRKALRGIQELHSNYHFRLHIPVSMCEHDAAAYVNWPEEENGSWFSLKRS